MCRSVHVSSQIKEIDFDRNTLNPRINGVINKFLLFICLICKQPNKQQNICITFVQRRPNVFDVGPTLYKCNTNVLCLLGCVQRLWLVLQSLMFRVGDHIVEAEWSITYLGECHICRSAILRCIAGCLKAVHESLWTNIVSALVQRRRRWSSTEPVSA